MSPSRWVYNPRHTSPPTGTTPVTRLSENTPAHEPPKPRASRRRRLLAGVLATGAVLGGLGYFSSPRLSRWWLERERREREVFRQRLVALAGTASLFVGQAYLRESGSAADAEMLARSLESRIGLHSGMRALRKHYLERVREDFRQGETVRVSGWELSSTEALLAALAATKAGTVE